MIVQVKTTSIWECQQCGAQSPKWAGRCPECGAWNALVETAVSTKLKAQSSKLKTRTQSAKPQKLSEVLKGIDPKTQRVSTGVGELDRVLGSGLVPGAVVLLAGEPGMGKSTLLSQVALAITANSKLKTQNSKINEVLYVCGEESPSQVAIRLGRLYEGPTLPRQGRTSSDAMTLFPETDVDAVCGQIEKSIPALVIVDSIQAIATADLASFAGSVGQIRESAGRLSAAVKRLGIPLFLVGHVTKEGEVAGPKVLEHMVDVVLLLEGDRSGSLRMVRAVKNRFGPVDEVGLFAMDDGGMREVTNPAELLIGDQAGRAAGSVLGCVLEGQRPLIVEIQALVVPSKLAVPRRVGQGVGERRLQLLCAVIEKHLGLGMGERDVFVSVAGGLKSQDPGMDLPVVAAIVSSLVKRQEVRGGGREAGIAKSQGLRVADTKLLPSHHTSISTSSSIPSFVPIFSGEVGLLGEVRRVQGWERREKEVKRLGLGKLVGKPKIDHIGELQKFL